MRARNEPDFLTPSIIDRTFYHNSFIHIIDGGLLQRYLTFDTVLSKWRLTKARKIINESVKEVSLKYDFDLDYM